MTTEQANAGDLSLAPVIEVWGIERIADVLPQLEAGARYVAVHDGSGQSRVLGVDRVQQCDSQLILDMLPGGEPALYVDASTPQHSLPDHRPLLVRRGALLIGLLESEAAAAVDAKAGPSFLLGSGGGADARAAAMSAIDGARDAYRRKGIPLMLDIQDSRVTGDGRLVRDLLDNLLESTLGIIGRGTGGAAGVYVTVGQGQAGLWIGVEDSGSGASEIDTEDVFADTPSDDLTVLTLRRMRKRVLDAGGEMRVMPRPSGTRFMVLLPAPS